MMAHATDKRKAGKPDTRDEYVSLQEAADYYKISTDSVRRYISQGLVPGYRLPGRTIRVKRSDLDKLARRIPTYGATS